MALMIGGPLHGKIMGASQKTLIAHVCNNDRAPKQIRQRGGFFLQCVYKRTRIIKDGEAVYRFVSGYYELPRRKDNNVTR